MKNEGLNPRIQAEGPEALGTLPFLAPQPGLGVVIWGWKWFQNPSLSIGHVLAFLHLCPSPTTPIPVLLELRAQD